VLELDPISFNARQLCQLRSHRDAILDQFAVDQTDNLRIVPLMSNFSIRSVSFFTRR
jgi:hypothetical protein